jgi:hypothetical protein
MKGAKKTARTKTRKSARKRAGIGSSLDGFLKGEGVFEETQAVAIKRVLAWRLIEEMKKQNVTKVEMARRMKTSRSQLDRLLDPNSADVRLDTLARAAKAINRTLKIELAAA